MSWAVELSERGDIVRFETFELAIDFAWRYAPEFTYRPMVYRDR